MPDNLRIAFAGDVMLGRGVDQIMRHPVDPVIYEQWAKSALRYVELAESGGETIPRRVDPSYVWGDSPYRLAGAGVDVRIVNLETAVTERGTPWPGKGIHYRVHPDNVACLVAGGIDAVTIANNHVLDWSEPGLLDTIETLDRLGLGRTGAGGDLAEAWLPASTRPDRSARVVVLGVGVRSSGIDPAWEADEGRPGVALLDGLNDISVQRVVRVLERHIEDSDVTVVSIHWGPNWGYRIPAAHRRFARAMIDAGVDIVHGHSSHHPIGLEVYRERVILYGCGDLLTDYEGIAGHERYRPQLGAWYIVDLDPVTGSLQSLRLLPTEVRRFSITTPDTAEVEWLSRRLEEKSPPGTRFRAGTDSVSVEW